MFAGGFTMGVKRVMPVECQLEAHGFGVETAEQVAGVPVVNDENAQWPRVEAQIAFGNPRCTGFSTITAGYGDDTHGAWAKQTCDIHQLVDYAVGHYDAIIWESVQQAYTVGRPLIDYLVKEKFAPKGYRVAHLFINAASFGNAQQRKRYFFVGYRDDRNFNITPPSIEPYYSVTFDKLWELRHRETREIEHWDGRAGYDRDCYMKLGADAKATMPHLPNGWGMSMMGKYGYHLLPPKYKQIWDERTSDLPFSLHSIFRLNWLRPCPTLHSSAGRFLHPDLDRPVTIGELSTLMGWPDVPRGLMPVAQIAKGIVPDVGEWLAQQCVTYLNGDWGDEDWESCYNAKTGEWEGQDSKGALEKTFDLTNYVGSGFEREWYPSDEELGLYKRDRALRGLV